MLFPPAPTPADGPDRRTRVALSVDPDGTPSALWTGQVDGAEAVPVPPSLFSPATPLLGEHARSRFTRPHLRGHRVGRAGDGLRTGRDWSPRFSYAPLEVGSLEGRDRLVATGRDEAAGLEVVVELESLPGGALRGRATVTNLHPTTYVVEGLEVVLPVGDELTEVLDFTGRHERERTPQRHALTDGLWLREGRVGRPGLGSATLAVVGTPGFTTQRGEVLAVHVAWSGNAVLRVERDAGTWATVGGGELLQPGEVALTEHASYTTPWVLFAAGEGLDEVAAAFHGYQRSLPAHPTHQPVVLNVWEAVYFDHDAERLRDLADLAARVGVERFVLDDGWFRGRRDDTAGLGDWWVDEDVHPDGLRPLIDHVHALGMSFGLWLEPEMVNPDSDLYRAHPDWVLATGGRLPAWQRDQLVLDLARPEVWQFLFERIDALLTEHPVAYVKWDHNRDLLDAGSGLRDGAPGVHAQTVAFYELLDALAAAHPDVAWESCASGGGRIDLGVLERAQRVWTSDSTDALSRQHMQRWTHQLVAPEYAGAHVASPTSHTTGRTFTLDFRAATAMFGAFGIEWDLSTATEEELDRLAGWVARHRRLRPLLHTGRLLRPDSPDPAILLHGVVAADRSEALLAAVQLDDSASNRGVWVRVPGLDPEASYRLAWEGPVDLSQLSQSASPPADGPTGGIAVTGAALAAQGYWLPRRRAETVTLVHLTRA